MTSRTAHGLIIGKFYPLHAGHLALIRFAAERADRVTVLLMASRFESIPLAQRERWLRSETAQWPRVRVLSVPSDAPVDYGADIAWEAHEALIVAALVDGASDLGAVTAVFSSERYGSELAERLGAQHVLFDVDRNQRRVSGTAVRADVLARWSDVAASARLDLATRVIVVGAESSGTTTLARDLVAHYRSRGFPDLPAVEEYGREFTYALHAQVSAQLGRPAALDDLVWTTEQFVRIAREQTQREQDAALASPLVIADTDALATELWERRYVGIHSHGAATVNAASLPPRAVYILTDHIGVPFEQDGWRDGEHIRAEMTRWFAEELTRRRASWVLLRGDREERARYATALIDALWRQATTFESPPWADRTRLRGAEHG